MKLINPILALLVILLFVYLFSTRPIFEHCVKKHGSDACATILQ